jgi:hypothetical protein
LLQQLQHIGLESGNQPSGPAVALRFVSLRWTARGGRGIKDEGL